MNTKMIDAETVRLENKLEDLRQEVAKTAQAKDALVAEIGKKSDDFNAYMAMKDSEIKKSRTQMLEDQEDLNRQKAEFQTVLRQHQNSQANLNEEKRLFEIQKVKHEGSVKNIHEFITAMKRAYSLLGI